MLRAVWKRFSVCVVVILVALLVSNTYATPPNTTPDTQLLRIFIAADLTLPSPVLPSETFHVLPSEIFVLLKAEGPADRLNGTLSLFFPPIPCGPRTVAVSEALFTNPTGVKQAGNKNLTFSGEVPPDSCTSFGLTMVTINIGPILSTVLYPPNPCVLTFSSLHGRTVTYAGKTVRFIVGTVIITNLSNKDRQPLGFFPSNSVGYVADLSLGSRK